MESRDPPKQIRFLSTLLCDNLASQIAQIVTNFGILNRQLLVKTLFLSESSLEHIYLLSKLIIFKLIFVCLTAYVFITLFAQFLELSMLSLFQRVYHIVCLIKLLSQVRDDTVLVFFEIRSIQFKVVHQRS